MFYRNINERNCVHLSYSRQCSAILSSINVIYCYFLHILMYNHLLEYRYSVFIENESFTKIVNLIERILIIHGEV